MKKSNLMELKMKTACFLFFSIIFISICSTAIAEVKDAIRLTSPNFKNQTEIGRIHTCDGESLSPALQWSGTPEGTRSFALIIDDPDAPDPGNPKMTWVHWVIYNIPASTTFLAEGASAEGLPKGTRSGVNSWNQTGYGGPCPPIGTHRYFHKIYALDIVLPDLKNPTKKELEAAMNGHILAQDELVGLYHR